MTQGVHLPHRKFVCNYCGKESTCVGSDTNRKFCSQICKSMGMVKPVPEKICPYCKKRFVPKRKHKNIQYFCSRSCGSRFRWFNPENFRTSRFAKALLLKESNSCRKCGFNKTPGILQIHHLDKKRYHNYRSNLIILCPNCHEELHYLEKSGRYCYNLGRGPKRIYKSI